MEQDASIDPSFTFTGAMSRRSALRSAGAAVLAGGVAATLGRGRAAAISVPSPEGQPGQQPNHFVLAGAETRITYDLTTIAGGPQLAYDGPYGSHSFDGDGLTTEETALGPLTTAYLGAFPDRGDLWLSLLVPRFEPMTLDDGPASFVTLAIYRWLVSTIAGPPQEGALEEYDVLVLEGTAELVVS